MLKFTLWFTIFLCVVTLALGQGYYNQNQAFLKANGVWTFQKKSGLDFRSGSPKPMGSAITAGTLSDEAAASVCDRNTGDLLFYSNGVSAWDKNGTVMPNGTGLLAGSSTAQGVCIVPVINDSTQYYLFCLYGSSNSPYPASGGVSLSYSVVDMKLNGGLGDLVTAKKNIQLSTDSLSESMIAIPGNNCDVWLLVHKLIDPVFKAYHITSSGIDLSPVVSETGASIKGKGTFFGTYAYKIGCMAVSPDRSRIAITSNPGIVLGGPANDLSGALVCKFEPQNGAVSEAIKMTHTPAYGIAFSPDNKKVYVGGNEMPQFDISTYDSTAIANSKVNLTVSSQNTYLRLFRDTIYCKENNVFTNPPQFPGIHLINQPNKSGIACDFKFKAILFTDTTAPAHISLPNEVVFPLPKDTLYSLLVDTLTCENQIVLQAPDGQDDYIWEDGSKAPTRSVPVPGTYRAWSKGSCHDRIDTFLVAGGMEQPVISVDVFELSTTKPYSSYQWLHNKAIISGATSATYTVTTNGDYYVIGTDAQNCQDTSEVYRVNNVSIEKYTDETQISIFPNPAQDNILIQSNTAIIVSIYDIYGKLYLLKNNPKNISTQHLANGMYLVVFHDKKGNWLKSDRLVIHK